MKLNECSVAHYATCCSPPDMMGFLFKKGEWNTAYHRRWFILKGNMLFYFEECESQEPNGVIVLEACTMMLCKSAEELAFTIKFDCAKVCVYKMAAENQAAMESWMKAVSRASFGYMRLVVWELEEIQDAPGRLQGMPKSSRKVVVVARSKSGTSSSAALVPSSLVTGSAVAQGETHTHSLQEEVQLLSGNSKDSKPSAQVNGCAECPPSGVPWEGNRNGNGGGDVVRPPHVPPRSRGASLS
ncbi:sesquipedalian-1-like [Salvelinus fontinalis]|uniref:sesquipedalian-1-like n=1 Tax=Salvelinus fontinalis TaxID=8038 RepID=UPI00248583E1|nr:sesquipedalian-1-like [Salvelinus fontinalis]